MIKNTGERLLSIPASPNLMGEELMGGLGNLDPMALLTSLLGGTFQDGVSQNDTYATYPLIARMLGEEGVRGVKTRGQVIDEAVNLPKTREAPPVTEAVPMAPQRTTAELLKAIDRMAAPAMKVQKIYDKDRGEYYWKEVGGNEREWDHDPTERK